ncbi:MAG: hypothetical protein RBR67_01020 [Desulfobacterium sp.]|nr:hypothetical protein [Desulfobacterium sp.]
MLLPKNEDQHERVVGRGFVVNKQMEKKLESGAVHRWQERWMVSLSNSHAQRRKKSFQNRLDKVESKLTKLKAKADDSADSFKLKAKKILQACNVEAYFHLEVNESITSYNRQGRSERWHPATTNIETPPITTLRREFHIKKNISVEDAQDQTPLLKWWKF